MAERKFFPRISIGNESTRIALKAVAGALWTMSAFQSCQRTADINNNIAAAQKINVIALESQASRQIVLNYREGLEAERKTSLLIACGEIALGLFFIRIRPSKPL